MKAPGDPRTRILLLFSLGIAAPSFLLGYLAFRGIQNDRALVELERRNEHRLIAARIGESLDEQIGQIERSLDGATEGLRNVDLDDAPESLDDLRLREPAIQGVFFLLRDGSVRFVSPRPMFSDGTGRVPSAMTTDLSRVPSDLEAGRVFELRDGNYGGALAAYREVLSEASDARLRGEALGAIARVQAKSGSLREAVDSYRSLLRDFGSLRMVGRGCHSGSSPGWSSRRRFWPSATLSPLPGRWSSSIEACSGRSGRSRHPSSTSSTERIRESVEESLLGDLTSGAPAAYRDTLLALAEEGGARIKGCVKREATYLSAES